MLPPKLILPVTDESLQTFIECNPTEWVENAGLEELVSALLLQQVPGLTQKKQDTAFKIEKALIDVLGAIRNEQDIQQLRSAFVQQLSSQKVVESKKYLAQARISLLQPQEAGQVKAIDSNGSWNTDFTATVQAIRSPFTLQLPEYSDSDIAFTEPQGRILNKFIAEPDESLHLQGYAGSGKTHLIGVLATTVPAEGILLLALTASQLTALKDRLPAGIHGRTFGQMASDLLNGGLLPARWKAGRRGNLQYQVADSVIAERLGLFPVGNFSPSTVAQVCRRTVMRFCQSVDESITLHHLPKLSDRLSAADLGVLVVYARSLWKETVEPEDPDPFLPVRGYHQVKHWDLLGGTIPERFSHVIVDEAHDLSPAMMSILDRSPQSVITLGDKYQRLTGFAPARSQRIRGEELDITVRSGREVEVIFNPLIEAHPSSQGQIPLKGSSHIQTICNYYERPKVPEHPTTILVGSEWHLFEWFQRLSHSGASFTLLPGSASSFKPFVEGLIDLFHNGKRARSPALFRYSSWSSLSKDLGHMRAFQRIETLFQKGYGHAEFQESLKNLVPAQSAMYSLGRVEDARNREFDSVMLTPELLSNMRKDSSSEFLAQQISTLYTGASRARRELILPGYLRDWLHDRTAGKNPEPLI